MGTNVLVYYVQHEAIKKFYAYYQNEDDSIATHLRNFKTMIAVIEHYRGDIFYDTSLIKHEKNNDRKKGVSEKTDRDYKQIVRDKKMVMAFLLSANKKMYGSLLNKLSDSYLFSMDVYPKTLNMAYELLVKHTNNQKTTQKPRQKKNDGKRSLPNVNTPSQNEEGNALTFAQSHELVPGTNGRVIAKIKCFKCNRYGHYADQCPLIEEDKQHHNDHSNTNEEQSEVETEFVQHMEEVMYSTLESDDDSVVVSFIHVMDAKAVGQIINVKKKPLVDILLVLFSTTAKC